MFTKTIVLKMAAGLALGAIAGYAYYYFLGCQGGCPLSSNWLTTTMFGAIFGLVLMFPDKKKLSDDKDK